MHLQVQKGLRGAKKAAKLGLTSERFQRKSYTENAEEELRKAKKRDRTELKSMSEWEAYGLADSNATKLLFNCPDQIDRVDVDSLSLQDFIEKYEKPNKAVIIRGVTKDWDAEGFWNFENFYDQHKDINFKVGEDDDGNKIRVKLKYFLEYMVKNKDDSPLYLFESSLETRKDLVHITKKYKVPKYFRDDLLSLAGEKRRPPYRWLLMGPERSGTTVHIDPLYTSAWNTSLVGHKRWVLFPEDLPKSLVKGNEFKRRNPKTKTVEDEAIHYFTSILPKIIEKEGRQNLGIIEFIQYPGETVFVPGGWWHAVINIDDTFAVTQNVMTHTNFDKVWKSIRKERRKFSDTQLYERAIQLNRQDGWIMGTKFQKPRVSLSRDPSSESSSSSSSEQSDSETDQSPSRSRSRDKELHKKR